jgi:hypothetical protein
MEPFLQVSDVIDWQHPSVHSKAMELAKDASTALQVAQRSFEWVRDNIQHSSDYKRNPVTCAASEVLAAGTGYCYAKSHLWPRCCGRMASPPDFVISGSVSVITARPIPCMASTPYI